MELLSMTFERSDRSLPATRQIDCRIVPGAG
ncbi:hypothetical protein X772_34295 [Mesorhizobium sp. LSJC280B00]|nr:hypothetical protein X772_34295 [Mesorhizobium sp. LSJC280B00]